MLGELSSNLSDPPAQPGLAYGMETASLILAPGSVLTRIRWKSASAPDRSWYAP